MPRARASWGSPRPRHAGNCTVHAVNARLTGYARPQTAKQGTQLVAVGASRRGATCVCLSTASTRAAVLASAQRSFYLPPNGQIGQASPAPHMVCARPCSRGTSRTHPDWHRGHSSHQLSSPSNVASTWTTSRRRHGHDLAAARPELVSDASRWTYSVRSAASADGCPARGCSRLMHRDRTGPPGRTSSSDPHAGQSRNAGASRSHPPYSCAERDRPLLRAAVTLRHAVRSVRRPCPPGRSCSRGSRQLRRG